MDERTLDHIGIAVPSLDDAIPTWTALTGYTPYGREAVENQGVEVVFIGTGPGRIELLAPTRADFPLARSLERRGPGLHHLCYRVPDIRAALVAHSDSGFQLIDFEPRRGAHNTLVAFIHPKSYGGVLIELLQANPH